MPHTNDRPNDDVEVDNIVLRGEDKKVKTKSSNESLEISINSFTPDTSLKLPFGKKNTCKTERVFVLIIWK